MKQLVKVLILVMAVTFSFQSMAQLKFGGKAGLNLATFGGDAEDAAMLIGFHVGGVADFEFTDMFSFQPGLLVSVKGATDSEIDEFSESLTYIEVPLNVVAKFNNFRAFAGPYVAFGLFGKVKWDGGDADVQFVGDYIDADADKVAVAPLDFGLNIGFGYALNEIMEVSAAYGLGFANLIPKFDNEDPDDTITNGVIQISYIYFLPN